MNDLTKNLLLWVVVAVVLMVVFQSFSPRMAGGVGPDSITYTQFLKEVDSGRVKSVDYTDETNLAVNAIRFSAPTVAKPPSTVRATTSWSTCCTARTSK